MDLREQIIQKIMQALDGRTDAGTADIVQDILTIELNNYEIQERCTDVALADDSADRMLKKFLATKRIEGIAESTLLRYAEENKKLIRFLGKPLYEVSTYDIRFYLSYRRENSGKKLGNLHSQQRQMLRMRQPAADQALLHPSAPLQQLQFH